MKITKGQLRQIIREELSLLGEGEILKDFDPLEDKPYDYDSVVQAMKAEKEARGNTRRLKRLMDILRHFEKGRRSAAAEDAGIDDEDI
jgi:hypothetical protein